VTRLRRARIGVVGDHPTGFGPCRYDGAALREATGVEADAVPLPRLFERAGSASADTVAAVRQVFAAQLPDLDTVDQTALDRSLRLHVGLRELARDGGWDALATRCWPECFTDFGGAACAPQSLLNQSHGLPALCEADAYGAVTSLILQELAGTPSFVADLIHLDPADDTAVFWHCGLAPAGMADPDAELHAGIHSNRRLPLLYEFALAPGRVTVARLSQSRGSHRMVIGGAEMTHAPAAFSGTSGVARLDRPAGEVLGTIVAEGLEHHYGIVYGDVREELHAVAAELALPVVEL
jgi:L-fucose isomerase-like protein